MKASLQGANKLVHGGGSSVALDNPWVVKDLPSTAVHVNDVDALSRSGYFIYSG